MSSFICSAKHFNSVEDKLRNLIRFDNDFYFPYSLRGEYPKLYSQRDYLEEDVYQEITEVMDQLRELNAVCVTLQYKHHYEGKVDQEIQEQKSHLLDNKEGHKSLSLMGLYNALRCTSYQIEPEHLEELGGMEDNKRKALLFLETMIDSVAHHIIAKMPKDEADQSWDI